jgi:hypothetical protein
VASLVKRKNPGTRVFTKIYFVKVGAVIVPIALCLGVGAVFLTPVLTAPPAVHLALGGGLIAFAVLLTAVVVVPDILKNRDHLTVTGDAITFEAWRDGSRVTLPRAEGNLLLVLPGFSDRGRFFGRRLTQLGTGRMITVSWFFPKRAIRRTCERSGWRFGYDPVLAERHLRRWRAWNWRMYASNFIGLHGPFTMQADPDGHLSLGAAILEEYGDEIIEALDGTPKSVRVTRHRLRKAAEVVYLRAASEQRAYAALADSAGSAGSAESAGSADERATRTAEADRLADTAAEVAPASAW